MDKEKNNKSLDLLLQKFEEIKLRNPRWSQRAFAQRLGLSSGALSEILRGKRPLNLKIKKRILEKIEFSPRELSDFLEDEIPVVTSKKSDEYMQLNQDQFHLISDWWHYGILNLVKTKDFKFDNNFIAKRFGLPAKVVNDAIERLIRIGFLVKQAGRAVRKYPRLATSDNILNFSVRKSHIEDLKIIEKAILDLPVELRDVVSMTFAIQRSDLPKAKVMIRKFQDEFLEMLETKNPDEVYKLTVALYPLTVLSKEGKSNEEI